MNHADDVAYSVHDLDDFYRSGLVPLEALRQPETFEREVDAFSTGGKVEAKAIDRQRDTLWNFAQSLPTEARYRGTYEERMSLRALSASLIHRFVVCVQPTDSPTEPVSIPEDVAVLMRFLQNLVFRYVIENPSLGTLQEGQRHVVRSLFIAYLQAIREPDKPWTRQLLPTAYRSLLERMEVSGRPDSEQTARLAIDIVASLSEPQANATYQRAFGFRLGSVHDHI